MSLYYEFQHNLNSNGNFRMKIRCQLIYKAVASPLLLFILFGLSTTVRAQERNILRGAVTFHGKPIENILIILTSPTQGQKSASTNPAGEYEIRNLESGTYFVSVSNTLYTLADAIGETFKPVEIRGRNVTELDLSVIEGGVIVGCVQYTSTQPVVGRQVIYEKTDSSFEGFSLMNFRARFTTDDQGCFRIYGLPPGKYIVGVGKPIDIDASDSNLPFNLTYFPGVRLRSTASTISLRPEQENNLGKLTINDEIVPVSVSGRFADNNTGKGVSGLAFDLIRYNDGSIVSSTKLKSDQDGRFVLENIFQGSYRIQPSTTGTSETIYTFDSIALIVAGSDIQDFIIPCIPAAAKIAGEILLNNNSATDRDCSIALVEGDSIVPSGALYRETLVNGTFSSFGLKRGTYTLVIMPLRPSIRILSAQVGGANVSTSGPYCILHLDLSSVDQGVRVSLIEH